MTTQEIAEIADAIGVTPADVQERHAAVVQVLRWFRWRHLPAGQPQRVSAHLANLAGALLIVMPDDDPELTTGLRKLVEAKDCLVRAAIAAGKAGGA